MKRRDFLRWFAIGGAAVCPICGSFGAMAGGKGADWGYSGESGPAQWGGTCALGRQQSPVDIRDTVDASLDGIGVVYKDMALTVVNNGRTIQANCAPGSAIQVGGAKYDLLQFHFHHPSEHTVNGRPLQMEAHFVHKGAEGSLAVLGVFIVPGRENALLAPLWAAMPEAAGAQADLERANNPAGLLPARRSYYQYAGSLTTPPCSETVRWMVFQQPVQASKAQIAKFAALFPNNRRPTQLLHRRFMLRGF